jgi:hypothetical protein
MTRKQTEGTADSALALSARLHGFLFAMLGLLAVAAASCLPIPHRVFRTPIVYGQLRWAARPLSTVRVKAVAEPKSQCIGDHEIEGITDQAGNFVLCPLPGLRLVMSLGPADGWFHWDVCVETRGQWHLIHSGKQFTLVDAGPRLISQIDCDLQRSDLCESQDDADITPARLRQVLAKTTCKGM